VKKRQAVDLEKVFKADLENPEFIKRDRQLRPYYDFLVQMINRRDELDLTQKELAEKAGTYQGRISKIESGEYDFRLSTLLKIAEALRTSLELKLTPLENQPDMFVELSRSGAFPFQTNLFAINPVTNSASTSSVTVTTMPILSELHRYGDITFVSNQKKRNEAVDVETI